MSLYAYFQLHSYILLISRRSSSCCKYRIIIFSLLSKFRFVYPNLWNPLIFLHFPQACCRKMLRFPLYLPLKTRTRHCLYYIQASPLESEIHPLHKPDSWCKGYFVIDNKHWLSGCYRVQYKYYYLDRSTEQWSETLSSANWIEAHNKGGVIPPLAWCAVLGNFW